MKRFRLYWFFFVGAVVLHGYMWINLSRHFTWTSVMPPAWTPVKTPDRTPAHWHRDAPPVGPFAHTHIQPFEKRLRKHKQHILSSKSLMAVPRRKTRNMGLELFLRDANHTDPGGDFFQLYRSGLDARLGTSIYENYPPDFDTSLKKKLDAAAPFHPPNRYPPPFAYTLGIWFSTMSPWTAYLAWVITHEIVLLFCIILSFKIRAAPWNLMAALAMWLGFTPWYLELYMGQTTFIIMAATFAVGLYLMKKISGFHAGTWLTLSLITKPVTLLFFPVLLKKRLFRLMIPPFFLAGAGTAAYFFFHPEDLGLFFGWMSGTEMVSSLGSDCFQNLLFHFHFSTTVVHVVMGVCLAAGLLVTFLTRWHPVRLLSFWVCVYFLAYTHVWQHHQVLLLPALILPFLITGANRFLIPWIFATLPSPFYWFEGHWNWLREVLYLGWGVLPVMTLTLILLFFWPKPTTEIR